MPWAQIRITYTKIKGSVMELTGELISCMEEEDDADADLQWVI